ncbi:hypothetical protein EJ076_18470 [Mesorhizobium sp. M7D.F.Ca.US.005.01.1.1]|jgi:hypothetical protein|uniref:hypothetical protein n=1 Tax=Mesorhizobium sp. M7D.F.Ca.US.005.01.1.1 TaxID=2493678 RepID=UPI000F753BB8|nr:hypothetical protein [Mesorhizobium sp. M7D.F.Ca.US.005.01.1.1]AZO42940.1 hypothetical protein EJ076_18470 [Mesorhizobium sp. M7D.F.Ca.US.005.01.1.1]
MLKKIALAAVLFQVAALSALLTQTVLFASSTATQAANVQPETSVAVTEKECAKATWPDIPDHCLKRIEARKLITMTLITAGQQPAVAGVD